MLEIKKSSYLLILVLATILISCSDNSEMEVIPYQEVNITTDTPNARDPLNVLNLQPDCSTMPYKDSGYTSYVVRYADGLSKAQKQAVRDRQIPGYIYCIQYDYCPTNPDLELWIVIGYPDDYPNTYKPKSQRPIDPDLRSKGLTCD